MVKERKRNPKKNEKISKGTGKRIGLGRLAMMGPPQAINIPMEKIKAGYFRFIFLKTHPAIKSIIQIRKAR